MTVERVDARRGTTVDPVDFVAGVAGALGGGRRFAALIGSPRPDGGVDLRAVIAAADGFVTVGTTLSGGKLSYPSLSLEVPAAAWYERELHDRYGITAEGHPRLDPLVLPLLAGDPHPALEGGHREPIDLDPRALDAHASGEGLFTIPYGPVRSGVVETVEYLVETFGEDIPRVRSRVYHKHRAIDVRFGDLRPGDAVLLAERVEGTVSVAHAIAYCRALEALAESPPGSEAELLRVAHAEIERIVNHLESTLRHTEGAYQIVANARLAVHKERLMRLRARLCGNRFGRNVVVPGGVRQPLPDSFRDIRGELLDVGQALVDDIESLLATPSVLDRLRGAGVLPEDLVATHGALGPVGRGSGLVDDTRQRRSYGAYIELGFQAAAAQADG
ncbi:MAG: NADH-quinone oxidoreductase subunit D-related protein, partial [Acidimicrobiales bacterium]